MAATSLAGIPLFFISLVPVLSIAAGVGILLAPESLLGVRRLASTQHRQALQWSSPSSPCTLPRTATAACSRS